MTPEQEKKESSVSSQKKNQTLSLIRKTSRNLKSAEKICLYAFFGCLICAGLILAFVFLPDFFSTPESRAMKTAESYLSALKSGDSWSTDLEPDFYLIRKVQDLDPESESAMPAEFRKAYDSALIKGWELSDLNRDGETIVIHAEVETLDPDTFSVSQLRAPLQNELNEVMADQNGSFDLSKPDQQDELKKVLREAAYNFLSQKLEESDYTQVDMDIILNSDGNQVLQVTG